MAEDYIQVALDSTGKKVRNVTNTISGTLVYQQVTTLAKSDGTLLDDLSRSSVTQPVNPSGETAGVGVGAAADAEAAGNGSAIALLKRLRTLLALVPVSQSTPADFTGYTPVAWPVVTVRDDFPYRSQDHELRTLRRLAATERDFPEPDLEGGRAAVGDGNRYGLRSSRGRGVR